MFPSRRTKASGIATGGGDVFRDEHSLAFDGTDGNLNFGDITALDGLDDMTISMWVNYKDTNNQVFITKGNYNSSGSSFYFNIQPDSGPDGRLRFSVDGSGGSGGFWYRNSMALAGRLEINKWNHVAVSYSSTNSTVLFYINGTEWAYTSSGGSFIAIPNTNHDLKIGTDSGENAFSYSNISDVAIYNTNLSHSQVNQIYNGREPYNHKEGSLSKNLVSWWRMGDGRLDEFNLICDEKTPTIGSDLITNGGFDGASGWTVDNFSIGSGVATTSTNGASIEQSISISAGDVIKIVAEIKSYSSGSIRFYTSNGSDTYRSFSSDGVHTHYLIANNTKVLFYSDNFNGSLDNVKVYKVNGYPGTMINMDADEFVGDTP